MDHQVFPAPGSADAEFQPRQDRESAFLLTIVWRRKLIILSVMAVVLGIGYAGEVPTQSQ